VFSRGAAHRFDERPPIFTLAMVARGAFIGFCLWFAAGSDAASFIRLPGLDWIRPTANRSATNVGG
jgi:hypothetical protein